MPGMLGAWLAPTEERRAPTPSRSPARSAHPHRADRRDDRTGAAGAASAARPAGLAEPVRHGDEGPQRARPAEVDPRPAPLRGRDRQLPGRRGPGEGRQFLPGSLRGKRTLFVGNGSVDAYVDFAKLGSGAVKVNADRTAATITLPAPNWRRPTWTRRTATSTPPNAASSTASATSSARTRTTSSSSTSWHPKNPNRRPAEQPGTPGRRQHQADAGEHAEGLGFTTITVQQPNAQ